MPFAAGAAKIYRMLPGQAPEIVHDRFFAGPGQLIRVNPDGTRVVVVAGLTRPPVTVKC